MFGFTLCAPIVKALILRIISGIGWEPTTPILFDFVINPSAVIFLFIESAALKIRDAIGPLPQPTKVITTL